MFKIGGLTFYHSAALSVGFDDNSRPRKKPRVADKAPSTLCLEYDSLQNDSNERILDDIPTADGNIPPVSLLFDGFGKFLDTFRSYDALPLDVGDTARTVIHSLIDKFAEKMCKIYSGEIARNDECLAALNDVFRAFGINDSFVRSFVDGRYYTDGHIETKLKTIASIVEFKNKANSAGVHAELAGYASRVRWNGVEQLKVSSRWRTPCLGISAVGES